MSGLNLMNRISTYAPIKLKDNNEHLAKFGGRERSGTSPNQDYPRQKGIRTISNISDLLKGHKKEDEYAATQA